MIIIQPRATRLKRVHEWVKTYLGEEVASSSRERAKRLLEEAIELAQAEDISCEDVIRLAYHVYDKPVGEAYQEVGGIGVTILAYCAAKGLDPDIEEQREIDRIHTKSIEHFKERHQKKVDAGVAMPMGRWFPKLVD